MRAEVKRPPIVQTGDVRTIFATGVVAIDRGDGYVQVTFCQDQKWGREAVQEREIAGRVLMTCAAWAEFLRVAAALGLPVEQEAATAH